MQVLMGMHVQIEGEVLIDLYKPYTQNQDVTIYHEVGVAAGM